LAPSYERRLSELARRSATLLLFATVLLLPGSGCGLDHYEQQMEAEQKRVKYLDDENQNLEGNPLKLPEKKAGDKEAIPANDFFYRPPKGISTTPDPKPIGILYRYPSTDPNANIQELLVAAVKTKEGTDNFRTSVLQTLRSSFGLREGEPKTRDAGGPAAGHTVHYDYFDLQGAPNQPGGVVYFYREYVQGEGAYQVALAFRAMTSQPVIANESPALELTLASLRVDSAARAQHNRYKPPPEQSRPRTRR
jgi:hypothetical protein